MQQTLGMLMGQQPLLQQQQPFFAQNLAQNLQVAPQQQLFQPQPQPQHQLFQPQFNVQQPHSAQQYAPNNVFMQLQQQQQQQQQLQQQQQQQQYWNPIQQSGTFQSVLQPLHQQTVQHSNSTIPNGNYVNLPTPIRSHNSQQATLFRMVLVQAIQQIVLELTMILQVRILVL